MSLVILLVEPDVDVLGKLAEALRSRGLSVLLSNSLESASSRPSTTRPNGVLIGIAALGAIPPKERGPALVPLGELPRLYLATAGDPVVDPSLEPDRVDPADLERIVSWALALRAAPTAPEPPDLRGDLQQVPLPDLVQLLAMHRRSGTLSVVTPSGNGDLRLEEGDVTSASFRHLRGEKAFFRLLRESDGSFSFAPSQGPMSHSGASAPTSGPRMLQGTSNLILEAMRHRDEAEGAAEDLGVDPTSSVLFVARGDAPPEGASPLMLSLWRNLESPRPLAEVLDAYVESDAELLRALRDLVKQSGARRMDRASTIVPLAPDDHLPSLRALVTRLHRPGFHGAPRVAIAGSQERLATFCRSLLRVQGAVAPPRSAPAAPIPHDIGLLKLGEGAECAFTGLPIFDAFTPTWTLALAGVGVVISLDVPIPDSIASICDELELRCIAARELAGSFVEADPEQVAALLRAAIAQA